MSLDFYRAKTKDDIDFDSEFISLEEELQEFLYKNRGIIRCDIACIYKLDPYGDTKLDCCNIKKIMNLCGALQMEGCLLNYEDGNAVEVFSDLEQLCRSAIEENQNIFVMGD